MPKPTFDTRLAATLAPQVAEQVGKAILEERLAPGERIRETNLAETFSVSRATVREALRILERRGLVRIVPQRGANVTLLSPDELQDLFEIRSVLLGLASRLAARQYEPAQRPRLYQALARLNQARDRADEYVTASSGMVDLLLEMSGNHQLADIVHEYAQRIGRYVRRGLSDPRRRTQSLEDWHKVVSAIEARDELGAETTHRHLAQANRDAAMALLASEGQARTPGPSKRA